MQAGSSIKRPSLIIGLFLVLLTVASLALPVTDTVLASPADVVGTFVLAVRQLVEGVTQNIHYNVTELREICPRYFQVLTRLGTTVIAVLCGAMVALAGSVFQSVFRNPIAGPSILGVSNGVTLGTALMVLFFGSAAAYMTGERFLACYVGAFIVFALVIGLALLLGKGQIVPVDILLIGSVISALTGQFVAFLSFCVFDSSTWTIYNELNQVLTVVTEPISYASLAVAFLVSVTPLMLLRFRMNMLSFGPEEARAVGIDQGKLRIVCLVCGTIMTAASQVHLGTIGMTAMVAPFLARKVFGVEYRKQFWGTILIGSALVLFCTDLAVLVDVALTSAGIAIDIPRGVVTNLVMMPLFAWVMTKLHQVWGER